MTNYLRAFLRLPQTLTWLEKLIVLGLFLVVITTAIFWSVKILNSLTEIPVKGGVYTEGIVSQDPFELDLITAKLTGIGLTYTDHKGEIKGALAESWEIAPDGKRYTFHLRPDVEASDIIATYSTRSDWQNIKLESPDNKTVVMTLKQPFAPLLSFTSDPVLQGGPYLKDQQTDNQLTFVANKDFVLGEPNLQKIVLTLYPDERSLKAAFQRQEILAANQPIRFVNGTTIKKLKLTKQTVILFNLDRDPLKDKTVRQQIRDNQKSDKRLNLTLVTDQDPAHLAKANALREKVGKIGINISIKSLNPIALEREALKSHDYDLLLTDLNYGYDEDPYPYWHSSQIIPPGKNYAEYSSKETDKLIEEARQTLDQNERQKKYKTIQDSLNQDIPAIFYPQEEFQYTLSQRIKGVTDGIGALAADRYTEVWQWFIKAKRKKS